MHDWGSTGPILIICWSLGDTQGVYPDLGCNCLDPAYLALPLFEMYFHLSCFTFPHYQKVLKEEVAREAHLQMHQDQTYSLPTLFRLLNQV